LVGVLRVIKHLVGSIGFLTIIPVGGTADARTIAEGMYMFPLVGLLIGAAAGLIEYVALDFGAPRLVSAVLTYGFICIITGLHHFDGLADFGDGLMCIGDRQRKIQAMRDVAVGAGGVGAVLLVGLLTVSVLSVLPLNTTIVSLSLAEMDAKYGMVVLGKLGDQASTGMSGPFIAAMRDGRRGHMRFAAATAITVAVSLVLGGVRGAVGLAASGSAALAVLGLADREFGGVTGDVFGAANEVVRLCCLMALYFLGVSQHLL
jgi:adenosylcobinamide-GDP ribazoletransferase